MPQYYDCLMILGVLISPFKIVRIANWRQWMENKMPRKPNDHTICILVSVVFDTRFNDTDYTYV